MEDTQNSALPLISIGIPLYRSARFVEVIAQNIRAIEYPNVEILVSDRHEHDDAISQLQAIFGSDSRVRFLVSTDQASWVDNM